jgi:plastocyanin
MRGSLKFMLTLIVTAAAVISFSRSAQAIIYEVEIENFSFVPGHMQLNPGDGIQWTNRDAVPHTSTSDDAIWDSGILSNGESYTFIFENEGVFPYYCTVHPSMVDTVFVETPVGIDDNLPSVPDRIELSQNYPNPFNAQTVIAYSLPSDSHVKITVYNLLGQSVETLVDADESAGDHRVTWNADDVPTGVYFYRIDAAEFTATRKMLLAK